MTEEKSLVDLMREEAARKKEKEEEITETSITQFQPRIQKIEKDDKPGLKITINQLQYIVEVQRDEEFEKVNLIKNILKYTSTEKALHTCGEILKGKSLPRTNKKILANEIKQLIDEKILGVKRIENK